MLIKNARFVIAPEKVLEKQDIIVEDDVIRAINPTGKGHDKTGEIIDASGMCVMPGLVNAHTHLAMTLFRGHGDDLPLHEWLEKRIWPVEDRLKPEHVYWGSLLGCVEMIKSGTTCFNDMYFFMHETARAVDESGTKALLSSVLFDADGKREKHINNAIITMKKWKNHKRIRWAIGPHAIYTCSEELFLKSKELAQNYSTRIHIHLSETRKEVYDCQKEHGMRPVEYLESIGFLGPEVIAAHVGWVTKQEIRILAKHNVCVAHCPVSNMKLGVGSVLAMPEMTSAGVGICIGTDGAGSNNNLDMFEEMKFAALLQKAFRWDPSITKAKTILDMATKTGAKAHGFNTGSVEVGKHADLILVNIRQPNLMPVHDIVSTLVYSAHGENVDTVIIDGKIVMRNRELNKDVVKVDEQRIYEKVEDCKAELFW